MFKKHISKINGKQVADFLPRYFDHECRSPTQKFLFLLHKIHIFSPTQEICHVSYTGDPLPFPAAAISSLFHCTGHVGTGLPETNLVSVFLEMREGVLKLPLCLKSWPKNLHYFISVHPSQGWIDQVKLTQFLCHVEFWLHLPESSRSMLF